MCISKMKDGVNSLFHVQLLLKIEKNCISVTAIDRNTIKISVKDIVRNSDKVN